MTSKKKPKLTTWAEAVKRTREGYDRYQSGVEARRDAEAEQYRLDYQTSITCGHRDKGQSDITVAEFDFQLCDDCITMIINGLEDENDDS